MSVSRLQSVLESIVGATFRPYRDGILVNTNAAGDFAVVTRYLDEPAALAAVDALAAAMRARGVVAATVAAAELPPAVVAPYSSAFAVSDTPPPEDMVIRGGKITKTPTHAPPVAAPPDDVVAAPPAPVAAELPQGVRRRRGKGAK